MLSFASVKKLLTNGRVKIRDRKSRHNCKKEEGKKGKKFQITQGLV